jgi:hypothetical protein
LNVQMTFRLMPERPSTSASVDYLPKVGNPWYTNVLGELKDVDSISYLL